MPTKKTFEERVLASLLEHVEEDMDEGELKEAIKENLDLSEMAKEILEEEEVKDKIKAKLRGMILDEIQSAKTLEDITGDDDFDIWGKEDDDSGLKEMCKNMIKEDEELQDALKIKLRKILVNQIKNLDDDDVFGQDSEGNEISLADLINREEQLKALLQSEELQKKLAEILQALLVKHIEELELDDENIPEDELDELVKQTLKALLQTEEIQKLIKETFQPQFVDHIEKLELDDDDIPEDMIDGQVAQALKTYLEDPEGQKKIQDKIAEDIESAILDKVADRDTMNEAIEKKLADAPKMQQLVQEEVDKLLRDRDFMNKISEQIKNRLSRDSGLTGQLLDGLVAKIATLLVERLFEKR
ncbi:MAG: hypothetical protein NTX82_06565 [Candidatus Parcubacteria bacterium]|nr:hypothetical protein [Candidatus Parcubacteria bacterium]